MTKITESESLHSRLETKSTLELLQAINAEDQKVALSIQDILPEIAAFVEALISRFAKGGRLFYLGAGTSGRLGVLDASEIPPTYGLPAARIIGLIAGGDGALRRAVEKAEDNPEGGWNDLQAFDLNPLDTVVGIASSGSTPYVVGALKRAQKNKLLTACITNNPESPITQYSDFPIVAVVGPEFITGSTRMKGGTSQKLILNMISTCLMVRTGRVHDNKMVYMQLNNEKLETRALNMVMDGLNVDMTSARELLETHGSVAAAMQHYKPR